MPIPLVSSNAVTTFPLRRQTPRNWRCQIRSRDRSGLTDGDRSGFEASARHHVRVEASGVAKEASPLTFREVFMLTSFKNRNLFAASQAGPINNLNDGMSWGIFPLFCTSLGLGVERIGILKAVYPMVWGVGQVVTGPLSDRWGRRA